MLFRPERGKEFTGNRNRIENNRFVKNGAGDGFAVDVQGGTRSIFLTGNTITETRGAAGRTAGPARRWPLKNHKHCTGGRSYSFQMPIPGSAR